MVAMDSVSSAGPYDWLIPMQPKPMADTSRPWVPNFRFASISCSMRGSLLRMRRGGVIFGAGIRFARPPFQNPHANRFGAEALGGGLRREVQIDVPALNRRACVSHQVVAGEAGIAEDADSRTQRQHTRIGRDDTIVRD